MSSNVGEIRSVFGGGVEKWWTGERGLVGELK